MCFGQQVTVIKILPIIGRWMTRLDIKQCLMKPSHCVWTRLCHHLPTCGWTTLSLCWKVYTTHPSLRFFKDAYEEWTLGNMGILCSWDMLRRSLLCFSGNHRGWDHCEAWPRRGHFAGSSIACGLCPLGSRHALGEFRWLDGNNSQDPGVLQKEQTWQWANQIQGGPLPGAKEPCCLGLQSFFYKWPCSRNVRESPEAAW